MKRSSFFLRLFAGNLLLVIVIIVLGGAVAYHSLDDRYQAKIEKNQWRMLRVVQHHIRAGWPMSGEQLDAYADVFADTDYRLTVIDMEGRVLADSRAVASQMENHNTPDRPEVQAAIAGHRGRHADRDSDTLGIRFRYLALPVIVADKPAVVVRLAMPIQTIVEQGDFIRGALFWGAVATILAAIVLGLLLSWLWYRPLRLITRAARRLASGDLTGRPHVRGAAELEELSAALNEMRMTVSNQLDLITAHRENLRTILANLGDGVVALDREGNIVFMNQPARDLLVEDDGDVTGKHVQAVIRIADVVDVIEELLAGTERLGRQIETDLRGRRCTLHLQASVVTQHKTSDIWMVLVVSDITDTARATAMKAEFVANASHELRTPLATLRGVVDSLTESDADTSPETLDKFVDMLNRNVSRLENMTNDLLDLHVVENAQLASVREEVPLGGLVLRAQAQFAPRAREKGIELAVQSNAEDVTLRTDRKLLDLIIHNLVDNAIKFTPDGGRVSCDMSRDGEQVVIRVEDSGCGISPEDQAKVFDRFFQANASRTGDSRMRGTGLGLAIVRHACDRLEAAVDLQSVLGQGTTVTVRVPVTTDAASKARVG